MNLPVDIQIEFSPAWGGKKLFNKATSNHTIKLESDLLDLSCYLDFYSDNVIYQSDIKDIIEQLQSGKKEQVGYCGCWFTLTGSSEDE